MISTEHREKFEELGPDRVRELLGLGKIKGPKHKAATVWLEVHDRAHERESNLEQTEIQRSATKAAWVSADEAKTANKLDRKSVV